MPCQKHQVHFPLVHFQLQINSFTMFGFLPCNLHIVKLSIFVLHVLVSMYIPFTSSLIPHNCDKMFLVLSKHLFRFCGWLPWMLLVKALVCGSYDFVFHKCFKISHYSCGVFHMWFFQTLLLYVVPHAKTFPLINPKWVNSLVWWLITRNSYR